MPIKYVHNSDINYVTDLHAHCASCCTCKREVCNGRNLKLLVKVPELGNQSNNEKHSTLKGLAIYNGYWHQTAY